MGDKTLLERNATAVDQAVELIGTADALMKRSRGLIGQLDRSRHVIKDVRESNWAALANLNQIRLRACLARRQRIQWEPDDATG